MLWMWWFFLGCQSKLKQPQKLAFKITIKDTSNEVKLNQSNARLQSFFSPLGFAMILLQGWNHFWKAITMKRSIKEVATMTSGKNMEMSARNATAASSCGKTFASFVSTSCRLLAFLAAKKGTLGGSFSSTLEGLTCHPKGDDHQHVGDELQQDHDAVLHEVHFLPPPEILNGSSA